MANLEVVAWNCRGFANSIPYIHKLINDGHDIIILEEHWLWPYELSSLKSVHPDFSFVAVSDKRLNSSSDHSRGCSGVAILWKKSLRTSLLKLLENDRLCGLEVHLEDGDRSLYILGVYMPSADQPQDVYSTYLDSTEHVISQLSSKGPLIILSDLNAHLGSRDSEAINHRGHLWNKVIEDDSHQCLSDITCHRSLSHLQLRQELRDCRLYHIQPRCSQRAALMLNN